MIIYTAVSKKYSEILTLKLFCAADNIKDKEENQIIITQMGR